MTDTVWIHQARPRPPWYELDSAAKDELLKEWRDLDARAIESGAESLGSYSIRGQSDFSTVEIWGFSSPENVFYFWADRIEANYAVWFAFSNQLGVALSTPTESREP